EMYPFHAIVIGCNEHEIVAVRQELANQYVAIEAEVANADDALARLGEGTNQAYLFLMKVNGAQDLQQVLRISSAAGGKPIVALMNREIDFAAVLSTIRAGASQVVLTPVRSEDLKSALEAVSRQFGLPRHTSKLIAVSGVSAGCGATTIALNVGAEIAGTFETPCILADLSLRMGRLATLLEIEPQFTTMDLFGSIDPLDMHVVRRTLIKVAERFQ